MGKKVNSRLQRRRFIIVLEKLPNNRIVLEIWSNVPVSSIEHGVPRRRRGSRWPGMNPQSAVLSSKDLLRQNRTIITDETGQSRWKCDLFVQGRKMCKRCLDSKRVYLGLGSGHCNPTKYPDKMIVNKQKFWCKRHTQRQFHWLQALPSDYL
jgi:hypothetical protein